MTTTAPEAPGAQTGTEGTPQDGTASTAPDPAAAGQQPPAQQDPAAPPAQPPADDTPNVIRALRDDFKAERQRRQDAERQFAEFRTAQEQRETERAAAEAERNRKLAIALGVATEDEPPDPAKLAEELQRTQAANAAALAAKDADIRQRDIRLAVLTQAPSHGANGALLMDSVSFLTSVNGLDPSAEGFGEKLGDAIKAAAGANPNYKLPPPPEPAKPTPTVPRSGGEHNTAPGGNRQWTLEDVERASAQEVADAQEAGLLVDLGYGPPQKKRV